MIDLSNLIDLMPSYYKEYDSYKDSNGKGLLEKFLNICGDYFKGSIISQLESFLEDTSLSNIDDLYINSLWEFLGEFPFLRSTSYNEKVFKAVFKGNNLSQAKEASKKEVKGLLEVTNSTYAIKQILPYVISLYKIRGTNTFFDILFRLFNLTPYIKRVEEYNQLNDYSKGILPSLLYSNKSSNIEQTYIPKLDGNDDLDGIFMDKGIKCNTCMTLFYEIGVPRKLISSGILTEDGKLYIEAVTNLIEKFTPYYIHPVIVFQNIPSLYGVKSFTITANNRLLSDGIAIPRGEIYRDSNGNVITPSNTEFPTTITPSIWVSINLTYNSDTDLADRGYLVGYKDSGNPEDTRNILWDTRRIYKDTTYEIKQKGIYYFIPISEYGKTNSPHLKSILIESVNISQRYILNAIYEGGKLTDLDSKANIITYGGSVYHSSAYKFDSTTNQFRISTRSIYHYQEGIKNISKPSNAVVTDKIQDYKRIFTVDKPGDYRFALSNQSSVTAGVTITATKEYEELLRSVTLRVIPNNLYIRGKVYTKGTKTYTSAEFNTLEGIKGVYTWDQDNQSYIPHDFNLDISAKDVHDNLLPVVINDKVYSPKDGRYDFNLVQKPQILSISIYKHYEIPNEVIRILEVQDPINIRTTPLDWEVIPNKKMGTVKLGLDHSIDITIQESLKVFKDEGVNVSKIRAYEPYVLISGWDVKNYTDVEGELTYESDGTAIFTDNVGGSQHRSVLVKLSNIFSFNAIKYFKASYRSSIQLQVDYLTLYPITNGTYNIYVRPISLNAQGDKVKISGLKANPDPDESLFSINVSLPVVTTKGLFQIPKEDSHWSNLQRVSWDGIQGYNKGTFGFTVDKVDFTKPIEGLIDPGTHITLIPYIGTFIDGVESIPRYDQILFGIEGGTMKEIGVNEYPLAETTTNLEIPFITDLTKSSEIYICQSIYRGTSQELFRVILQAPTLDARFEKQSQGYKGGFWEGDTLKFILDSLEDNITKTIKVYCNRKKPPFNIYLGNTPMVTNDKGEFTFTLKGSEANGLIVYADIEGNGSLTQDVDPHFTLDVTQRDYSNQIDLAGDLHWDGETLGETKEVNLNLGSDISKLIRRITITEENDTTN